MTQLMTDHAYIRSAQRNVNQDEIDFVIKYGKRERNAGAIFCKLYRKGIPSNIPPNSPFRRLEGTTVVLTPCGKRIITVYRDSKAFKNDRKKRKFNHLGKKIA